MNRLRLLFCGTPGFAVPSFQKLVSSSEFEILAAYTQPDRPRGRGQEVSLSPVKQAALTANVPVRQPASIRLPDAEQELRRFSPDAIVIIAYGQIIPASLLPKFRGAAPIHWAIANGESVSGNTTMRIDAGMDTGEMLLQQALPIGPDETAPEVAARLSQAGAQLVVDTLRGLAS